jgi:hypothetical protein
MQKQVATAIAVASLTMGAGTVQAAGVWKVVSVSDRSVVAIDNANRITDGAEHYFWVMTILPQTVDNGALAYDYNMTRTLIDCDARTLSVISRFYYALGSEESVGSSDPRPPAAIAAGTSSMVLADSVCGPPPAVTSNDEFTEYGAFAQEIRAHWPGTARAGEWVPIAKGDVAIGGADMSAVERNGDVVTVSVVTAYDEPPSPEDGPIAYFVSRSVIDCTQRTQADLSIIGYSMDGRPVDDETDGKGATPIEPNSMRATIAEVVCAPYPGSDAKYESAQAFARGVRAVMRSAAQGHRP